MYSVDNVGADAFSTLVLDCFLGIVILAFIGYLAFSIWVILDCMYNESWEGNEKVYWLLIIGSMFGTFIYFFVRRPQRLREKGH